jgi:hypothetical protein
MSGLVESARVILLGHVVERFFDRLLLVEAGDHHGGLREGEIKTQWGRAVDQQRGDQVGVEIAGDDRDTEDHSDRERHGDRLTQSVDPRQREPKRKTGPGEADPDDEEQLQIQSDVGTAALARRALEILDQDRWFAGGRGWAGL